jgi:hypothetical protein
MRLFFWAVVAVLGFGLMTTSYTTRARPDPGAAWAYGFVVVGPEPPALVSLPGRVIPTRLRLLPGTERTEAILKALAVAKPGGLPGLEPLLRPKLILARLEEAGIDAGSLSSGRVPREGRGDEVLAGAQTPQRGRLTVGGRALEVVGVLKPDLALFADCYLVPKTGSADDLFPTGDPSVRHATLIGLTPGQFRDRKVARQVEATFPPPKFARVMPQERLARRTYYAHLAGQSMLLVGGSGVLIGLYRRLAGRVRPAWLAAPLQEMQRRPRLVWAVHLVYFGLVVAGSLLIYELPEVQAVLLSAVRGQIGGSSGPLAVAGRAYGSGSIPRAAAVTFLVNFFLGSLACITLPSVVLPGAGAVLAVIRASLWGLLLGPTTVVMAGLMIPHSGTMLLEGEGYILATVFALLVPVRLLETGSGGTVRGRFGRALLLNAQASVLVALILVVAACYEAAELIWMAG